MARVEQTKCTQKKKSLFSNNRPNIICHFLSHSLFWALSLWLVLFAHCMFRTRKRHARGVIKLANKSKMGLVSISVAFCLLVHIIWYNGSSWINRINSRFAQMPDGKIPNIYLLFVECSRVHEIWGQRCCDNVSVHSTFTIKKFILLELLQQWSSITMYPFASLGSLKNSKEIMPFPWQL